MKLARMATSLAATALLTTCMAVVGQTPAYAATDAELALRWAPVHHQDTDSSDYDADYLAPVDFDGDWTMNNNWENQPVLSRLTGRGYFSVAETSTHWFLVYGYFHPRDWSESCSDLNCHENDLEGILEVVRKDGSYFGKLEAAVTVAHTDFYSYVPAGSSYTSGRESVDGTLLTEASGGYAHPATFQEAKGHGLKRWDGQAPPGGDGVVYQPTSAATGEVPASGNDRTVAYSLTDIFAAGGMWSRRYDTATFASYGTFRGDNYKDNAANAPWKWDDSNDGSDLPAGLLATDPAYLVDQYFNGNAPFSLTYTRNAYRG